ncbi:hypothetical protein D5S17_04655 [Pseudonocardiaceae bacterium YIM PH 21723]|nr:hypothetical protein D5S17_04655 [Pseudonocardiaceae bacterium YIM PH 21723]
MTSPQPWARRALLARLGVLGAVLSVESLLPPGLAAARPLDLLRPALSTLARDTLNGLVAFVVPGQDEYSRAQGTPSASPGGLQAKGTDFLIEALDNFVPFPDQIARPLAAAFASGAADLPLPAVLHGPSDQQVSTVDKALRSLLQNDETVPLSLVIALLLNLVGSQVNPLSLHGAFASPFSRLSFADKARTFQLIEGGDANLVATLDAGLPQPLRQSLSGLLKFVGGALLEFCAFGVFSEWAVYDKKNRQLTARPVGWQLSGYQPAGPVEGWDELRGYYQGRTEVRD